MFNLSSTSCWFLVGVASLECWCCLSSWCGRGKRVSDEPCHSKCLCNVFWDEVFCFRGSLFESFFGRSRISLAAYPENPDLFARSIRKSLYFWSWKSFFEQSRFVQDQFARILMFDLESNLYPDFQKHFKNLDPATRLKIERLGKR